MGMHTWGHILNTDLCSHLLSNSPGLCFQDFYQQCREAFLVNSDLTLRAQLTEFRDHKLIRTKKVRLCSITLSARNRSLVYLRTSMPVMKLRLPWWVTRIHLGSVPFKFCRKKVEVLHFSMEQKTYDF